MLPETLRTTRFNIYKFYMVITFRLCVFSEQTATFALHNIISLVFIIDVQCLQRGTDWFLI
jgi:hypothetical protein